MATRVTAKSAPSPRGRPPGPGPRFEENRNHIYERAVDLFSRKGFEAGTMREIAAAAGISPGLTYRYFPSKEAIVLELYRRLSRDFEQTVAQIPTGPVSRTFVQAMDSKFKGMAEYRSVLRSLISAGLNPNSGVYVMGPDTADIRAGVRSNLLELIRSSRTRSQSQRKQRTEEHFAAWLYVLHLALVFCWLHDPTPEQKLTRRLLKASGRALGILNRFMNFRPIARLLRETAEGLDQIFGFAPEA